MFGSTSWDLNYGLCNLLAQNSVGHSICTKVRRWLTGTTVQQCWWALRRCLAVCRVRCCVCSIASLSVIWRRWWSSPLPDATAPLLPNVSVSFLPGMISFHRHLTFSTVIIGIWGVHPDCLAATLLRDLSWGAGEQQAVNSGALYSPHAPTTVSSQYGCLLKPHHVCPTDSSFWSCDSISVSFLICGLEDLGVLAATASISSALLHWMFLTF